MGSIYGKTLKISVFGQSHSPAIGVTIDSFPAGHAVDMEALSRFMSRRAPGRDKYSTPRREADVPEFLSGIKDGVTCGAPICAVIRNTDAHSRDYDKLSGIPRPSHADYTSTVKYGGFADMSGGGHFSGRLTAPLCVAGALCLGALERNGVKVSASVESIGGVSGSEEEMLSVISDARRDGDSVGGIIRCVADGVPVGLGDPIFDGMENRIASIVFGIPGVRGIEFGRGFEAASMRGSEHNDPFTVKDGRVVTDTNNHGGILGGITSGMPVDFRVAMKPTPSIGKEQKSVNLKEMRETELTIGGRHDPCIALRALPCVEAACAIALLDAWLESGLSLAV